MRVGVCLRLYHFPKTWHRCAYCKVSLDHSRCYISHHEANLSTLPHFCKQIRKLRKPEPFWPHFINYVPRRSSTSSIQNNAASLFSSFSFSHDLCCSNFKILLLVHSFEQICLFTTNFSLITRLLF